MRQLNRSKINVAIGTDKENRIDIAEASTSSKFKNLDALKSIVTLSPTITSPHAAHLNSEHNNSAHNSQQNSRTTTPKFTPVTRAVADDKALQSTSIGDTSKLATGAKPTELNLSDAELVADFTLGQPQTATTTTTSTTTSATTTTTTATSASTGTTSNKTEEVAIDGENRDVGEANANANANANATLKRGPSTFGVAVSLDVTQLDPDSVDPGESAASIFSDSTTSTAFQTDAISTYTRSRALTKDLKLIDMKVQVRSDVLLYLLLFINYGIGYVFNNLNHAWVTNHYTITFLIFSCMTSLLKFFGKRLGKKVDQFRINNSIYSNSVCRISCEFYIEWYFSIYYYMSTKYWVSFNIPEDNWALVQVLAISLVQEIWETNLLFSSFYYNMRSIRSWCWGTVSNLGKECSGIDIWRARCCMDITIRFVCEVVCTVYYLLFFNALGEDFVNKYLYGPGSDSSHAYINGLIYTAVYAGVDIVHFLMTIAFNYVYYKYDMFGPIMEWYNRETKDKYRVFWYIVLMWTTVVSLQFLYY